MKLIKIFILLAVAAMTSCTIVDLEDPLKGKITLVTDWSKRSAGVDIPVSYTVVIANQALNFTQATNRLPELDAGTYPIHIYNTSEKVSVNGTTATVHTTGNEVHHLPDWFFTATTQADYTDFKEETITAVMQQQVRQLTIDLTVTEGDPQRIASTEATLSGVANSIDFKANTHSGTSLHLTPTFTRTGNKLTTTVRLLGVTNEKQRLTLNIVFTDGKTQRIESEISSLLANFNTNKYIPLSISADLNTPIKAGFGATITGWEVKDSSSGVAN